MPGKSPSHPRPRTREEFDRLTRPITPMLRSFILRLVAHPDDADELVQETLLQAYRSRSSFRGDSSFKTWVFSIGSRKALDHLRARRRWPLEAQFTGARTAEASAEVMERIHATIAPPDYVYDVREHIAYCFTCIGRTLEPECCAALLLREVLDFGNRDAARVLGLTESKFRHMLSSARHEMQQAFRGVCALVGKGGACYQCDGLRAVCPEPKCGPAAAEVVGERLSYDRRVRVAAEARFGSEPVPLQDYLLRFMTELHA